MTAGPAHPFTASPTSSTHKPNSLAACCQCVHSVKPSGQSDWLRFRNSRPARTAHSMSISSWQLSDSVKSAGTATSTLAAPAAPTPASSSSGISSPSSSSYAPSSPWLLGMCSCASGGSWQCSSHVLPTTFNVSSAQVSLAVTRRWRASVVATPKHVIVSAAYANSCLALQQVPRTTDHKAPDSHSARAQPWECEAWATCGATTMRPDSRHQRDDAQPLSIP